MTGLTTFAALQARVYEFLERQDEDTLRAIADGTARLAVAGADAAPSPVAAPARPVPSGDPLQAARDLASLTSEQDRRIYVNATRLPVGGLKRVAKLLGITGYSALTRAKLIDRLAGHAATRTPAAAPPPQEPARAAAPRPETAVTAPARPEPAVAATSRPETAVAAPARPERVAPDAVPEVPPPDAPTMPDVDPAAVAAHLRETETETEGAEYLRAQRLDRATLLAVAAELQLTRVDRLRQTELEKRVLKQAIGARRKFSGLRKW